MAFAMVGTFLASDGLYITSSGNVPIPISPQGVMVMLKNVKSVEIFYLHLSGSLFMLSFLCLFIPSGSFIRRFI
jgi:hypothetical protein